MWVLWLVADLPVGLATLAARAAVVSRLPGDPGRLSARRAQRPRDNTSAVVGGGSICLMTAESRYRCSCGHEKFVPEPPLDQKPNIRTGCPECNRLCEHRPVGTPWEASWR